MKPDQNPPQNQPNQSNQPGQPAPQAQDGQQPQFVYMSRPFEPHKQQLSDEAKQRHADSVKRFPKLNLSEGEYVIAAIKRHPIGLVGVWATIIVLVFAVVGFAAFLVSDSQAVSDSGLTLSASTVMIPAILITLGAFLVGFVATIVYNANEFFLTNESVIQYIQTSLFSRREQTISLANVEDASYAQDGILPHMLNYGMLRLSTEGDETTYRFKYASSPQKQINELNNAVENFKNVRPIE